MLNKRFLNSGIVALTAAVAIAAAGCSTSTSTGSGNTGAQPARAAGGEVNTGESAAVPYTDARYGYRVDAPGKMTVAADGSAAFVGPSERLQVVVLQGAQAADPAALARADIAALPATATGFRLESKPDVDHNQRPPRPEVRLQLERGDQPGHRKPGPAGVGPLLRAQGLRDRRRDHVWDRVEPIRPPGRGRHRDHLPMAVESRSASQVAVAEPLVRLRDVFKIYKEGTTETVALRGASLELPRGRMTSMVGPSGSGKSTLLSMIAGLALPSAGQVILDGQDISRLDEGASRALAPSGSASSFRAAT